MQTRTGNRYLGNSPHVSCESFNPVDNIQMPESYEKPTDIWRSPLSLPITLAALARLQYSL